MGDIWNLCTHKGRQDPDPKQVEQMINAVQDFMTSMP